MMGLRVAFAVWQEGDGLAEAVIQALRDHGCHVDRFRAGDRIPDNVQVVWAYGPMGSLVPLGRQLAALRPNERPRMILWMTEQLANPSWPAPLLRTLGRARSALERNAYGQGGDGLWRPRPQLRLLTRGAYRHRYLGDLLWLRGAGLITILATTSRWSSDYLRQHGLEAVVAYWGSVPDWGERLHLTRDVPVLWLGKAGSRRRRERLEAIRRGLAANGVDLLVIDGEEHPYVFDRDRTELLNRTVIVLNLLRAPWDDNSVRYYLAAQNGALIVTEPTLPHTPFEDGRHLVVAQADNMVPTLLYWLGHSDQRLRIVDNAYRLVSEDLTMRHAVAGILNRLHAMPSGVRGA